jgi:hypothetical protein
VIDAMRAFDSDLRHTLEWQNWEDKANHRWALVHSGRRYPVKQVLAMATGTSVNSFSGGPEANTYATRLGLTIEPLRPKLSEAVSPQIFLVTAGNAGALEHLRDTVDSPIADELCRRHLQAEEEYRQLQRKTGDGPHLYAWGAVPGPQNLGRWERLREGDYVLFVTRNHYIRLATVTGKRRDPALARRLWGEDEGGTDRGADVLPLETTARGPVGR